MHDRWPATLAMTVCSIAVLSAGVAAFVALSFASGPAALGLGGAGLIAAFLGLFAVIQWVRQAEESDPEYRHYRAVRIKARQADRALAAANDEREPAAAAPASRPEGRVIKLRADAVPRYGGNVVVFDPAKARRNRLRPL